MTVTGSRLLPPARRRLGPLLAVAVTVAGLTACGAGRDALGSSAGQCFMALPVARRAAQDRGRLAGVRLVDTTRLAARGDRPLHDLLRLLPGRPPRDVCLVAFRGSFTPGQVRQLAGPPPGGAGRYAIAVVKTPGPALLGTFVLRRLPVAFSRPHVGL